MKQSVKQKQVTVTRLDGCWKYLKWLKDYHMEWLKTSEDPEHAKVAYEAIVLMHKVKELKNGLEVEVRKEMYPNKVAQA